MATTTLILSALLILLLLNWSRTKPGTDAEEHAGRMLGMVVVTFTLWFFACVIYTINKPGG